MSDIVEKPTLAELIMALQSLKAEGVGRGKIDIPSKLILDRIKVMRKALKRNPKRIIPLKDR